MESPLAALSVSEPLSIRLDVLRTSRDRGVARTLCADENCPAQLREEALRLLDGTSSDDLLLALASCIPIMASSSRDEAKTVASRFMRNSVLEDIEKHLKQNEQERFRFLALWGLCSVCKEDGNVRSQIVFKPSMDLIDILAQVAGKDMLSTDMTKRELMGTSRPNAIAALCLCDLSVFVDEQWYVSALEGVTEFPLRSSAIALIVRNAASSSFDADIGIHLSRTLLTQPSNQELGRWTEMWYHGTRPENDDKARQVLASSLRFGCESTPLLVALKDLLLRSQAEDEWDNNVLVAVAAWNVTKPEQGLRLPWITEEAAKIASECWNLIKEKSLKKPGIPTLSLDLDAMRIGLGNDRWKSEWLLTSGFLRLCIDSDIVLRGDSSHLIALLLPLADDIDPRIAEPAWRAVITRRDVYHNNQNALLILKVIERNLISRHEGVLCLLLDTLKLLVLDSNGFLKQRTEFIARVTRDLPYLAANANTCLYSVAVDRFLCVAVEKEGLHSIRMMDDFLRAIEAGARKRSTAAGALLLLTSVMKACSPRLKAHRGVILKILLQLSVLIGDTSAESLKQTFAFYQSCLGEHKMWLQQCLNKVKNVDPSLVSGLQETL